MKYILLELATCTAWHIIGDADYYIDPAVLVRRLNTYRMSLTPNLNCGYILVVNDDACYGPNGLHWPSRKWNGTILFVREEIDG